MADILDSGGLWPLWETQESYLVPSAAHPQQIHQSTRAECNEDEMSRLWSTTLDVGARLLMYLFFYPSVEDLVISGSFPGEKLWGN